MGWFSAVAHDPSAKIPNHSPSRTLPFLLALKAEVVEGELNERVTAVEAGFQADRAKMQGTLKEVLYVYTLLVLRFTVTAVL